MHLVEIFFTQQYFEALLLLQGGENVKQQQQKKKKKKKKKIDRPTYSLLREPYFKVVKRNPAQNCLLTEEN